MVTPVGGAHDGVEFMGRRYRHGVVSPDSGVSRQLSGPARGATFRRPPRDPRTMRPKVPGGLNGAQRLVGTMKIPTRPGMPRHHVLAPSRHGGGNCMSAVRAVFVRFCKTLNSDKVIARAKKISPKSYAVAPIQSTPYWEICLPR